MPILILLLLTSLVSNAEDFSAIQGQLRIHFSRSTAKPLIVLQLFEHHSHHNKRLLSKQLCSTDSGDSCTIELPYPLASIDQAKRYSVDVEVFQQVGKIAYQYSFPVLTFNQPRVLNIAIRIPLELIE